MVRTGKVKAVLSSLQQDELRVGWLADHLTRGPLDWAARLVNELIEESERGDPAAREALLTVVLLLAGEQGKALVGGMFAEAVGQRLFSLERLLRKGPPPSVAAPPLEQAHVPDYGTGRELTLGERRSLARRPDRRAFDKLLEDPHPMVIRQLLSNPKMVEEDAIRLAARRPARQEIIRELGRSPRWVKRARVRMSILQNPGSPPEVPMILLCLCTRGELETIVRSAQVPVALRAAALEWLERRPPLATRGAPDRTLQ